MLRTALSRNNFVCIFASPFLFMVFSTKYFPRFYTCILKLPVNFLFLRHMRHDRSTLGISSSDESSFPFHTCCLAGLYNLHSQETVGFDSGRPTSVLRNSSNMIYDPFHWLGGTNLSRVAWHPGSTCAGRENICAYLMVFGE